MGTVDNAAATITTKKTMISILADKSNNILPNKYSISITLAARSFLIYPTRIPKIKIPEQMRQTILSTAYKSLHIHFLLSKSSYFPPLSFDTHRQKVFPLNFGANTIWY